MKEVTPIEIPGTIIRNPEALSTNVDAFIIHGKNWIEYPPGPMKKRLDRFRRTFHDQQGELIRPMQLANDIFNNPTTRNRIRSILKDIDQKPFNLRLSIDSKIAAIAAGMIWEAYAQKQEKPPMLIFSTGKTAGKEWPSEAEAMLEYMKARFPKIPEEHIRLEELSYDTPGNILQSKKIIEESGYKNVGYLTIGYHLPRVATLMDYYDLPIMAIHPTEQIVSQRSKRHSKFIDNRIHSNEWKKQKKVEALLTVEEAIFDPGQEKLSKYVTPRIRHQ